MWQQQNGGGCGDVCLIQDVACYGKRYNALCPDVADIAVVACTMEAKLCPDGITSVGRVGPNCDFADCPDDHTTTTLAAHIINNNNNNDDNDNDDDTDLESSANMFHLSSVMWIALVSFSACHHIF
jgi:hypothetical protein